MIIYGINKHGGKNNSDIIIHASGEGFNELNMLCDGILELKLKVGEDYQPDSTCDRVIRIAKELQQMMNPANSNPKRLFTTHD